MEWQRRRGRGARFRLTELRAILQPHMNIGPSDVNDIRTWTCERCGSNCLSGTPTPGCLCDPLPLGVTQEHRAKGPAVHELRCWPQYFQAVWDGDKTFEVRRDDRGGFEVGSILFLREYDPELDERPAGDRYTGRKLTARVTYVLKGGAGFGVESGFVVLGIANPG